MATVYEATTCGWTAPSRSRSCTPAWATTPTSSRRFEREARSAARLSHPNVVSVFDQGDDDGTLFLVMEYVPGLTLRDLIRKDAPMAPAKALALIEPVLAALAAAHRAGMIHRDVKPENVLLADDGRVKVADFGLARAVNAETQHTATGGVLIGTVSYLSPELVVDGKADARSDVYAAGVLLYEMLTGLKPHQADSPIQVAYKHVHEDVPAPSRGCPRPAGVRRRAGRPGHRPRPRPASLRRPGAAAPGAPGPSGARPRRHRRPGAGRRPARPTFRPSAERRRHRRGDRRVSTAPVDDAEPVAEPTRDRRPVYDQTTTFTTAVQQAAGARRRADRRTPATAPVPPPGRGSAAQLRAAGAVLLILVLLLVAAAGRHRRLAARPLHDPRRR